MYEQLGTRTVCAHETGPNHSLPLACRKIPMETLRQSRPGKKKQSRSFFLLLVRGLAHQRAKLARLSMNLSVVSHYAWRGSYRPMLPNEEGGRVCKRFYVCAPFSFSSLLVSLCACIILCERDACVSSCIAPCAATRLLFSLSFILPTSIPTGKSNNQSQASIYSVRTFLLEKVEPLPTACLLGGDACSTWRGSKMPCLPTWLPGRGVESRVKTGKGVSWH